MLLTFNYNLLGASSVVGINTFLKKHVSPPHHVQFSLVVLVVIYHSGAGVCVGKRLKRFLRVILCLENLSSGENRATFKRIHRIN